LFCVAAFTSFQANTSVIAFSNSKLICLLSSKLNSPFSKILLSTSLFTLLFKPEKENSKSLFTSQTRGNKSIEVHQFSLYSEASLEIIGQPGYQSHIILATLSKTSQPASSQVCHNFIVFHMSFIRYISLCPHETVKHASGKFISFSCLSKKFENI